MSEVYLKRTLSGLAADDEEAARVLKRIPMGTVVQCEVVRPRSAKSLRYYFALCRLVASNHETLQTKDEVDQVLRLLAGHVELVQVGDRIVKIPKRLAFSELGEEGWQDYLKRAKDVVLRDLLPGVELPAIEEEIARMVG